MKRECNFADGAMRISGAWLLVFLLAVVPFLSDLAPTWVSRSMLWQARQYIGCLISVVAICLLFLSRTACNHSVVPSLRAATLAVLGLLFLPYLLLSSLCLYAESGHRVEPMYFLGLQLGFWGASYLAWSSKVGA